MYEKLEKQNKVETKRNKCVHTGQLSVPVAFREVNFNGSVKLICKSFKQDICDPHPSA